MLHCPLTFICACLKFTPSNHAAASLTASLDKQVSNHKAVWPLGQVLQICVASLTSSASYAMPSSGSAPNRVLLVDCLTIAATLDLLIEQRQYL